MKKYKSFWDTAKMLKKELPTPYPVHIRRLTTPKDIYGDCRFKGDSYLIRVRKDLNELVSIDVLLHEYSHAMAWDQDEDPHGDNWGIAYSQAYRKLLEHWDCLIDRQRVAKAQYFLQ
jgi:hypothetical protein